MKRRLAAWRLALRWQQDALRRRHEQIELLCWTFLVWRAHLLGSPSSSEDSSSDSEEDSDNELACEGGGSCLGSAARGDGEVAES